MNIQKKIRNYHNTPHVTFSRKILLYSHSLAHFFAPLCQIFHMSPKSAYIHRQIIAFQPDEARNAPWIEQLPVPGTILFFRLTLSS
jgi:hypothetical protein